jgi:uncharacterized protein (TIGR03437 family)
MRSRFSGIVLGLVCLSINGWGQYVISTIAGNNTAGYSGDGAAPTAAQLNFPTGMAYSKGNLYIVDSANNVVRVVSNGVISTFAGTAGSIGFSGDTAAATSATLNNPSAVAVDSAGNVYIADTGNSVIRQVNTSGIINTFAGNYSMGPGYSGDGGAANNGMLDAPTGVAVDSAGNVYMTDSVNNLVRKVSGGNFSTIIGIGSTGQSLNHPNGLVVDSKGAVYVSDTSHRVLKYANGALTTFAGTGDVGYSGDNGPANKAVLNNPVGLAIDAAGNVYIADANEFRIRAVNTAGVITTIAGSGHVGYVGDGGSALTAYLNFPNGVCVDGSGNVYIADTENNVVRMLSIAAPSIAANGVVSSASFLPHVAPGSLASIAGTNLATSTPPEAATPLPTILAGASVSVNGKAAPILYASPTLINFQVPWGTATGNATVTVSVAGVASNAITVPVTATAPGIFYYSSGAAIAQNHDYSLNTSSNPEHAGSFIIAYLTGSGAVTPAVTDGAATPTTGLYQIPSSVPVTVTIGGQPAAVLFAGLTPGLIALLQLDITVPSGLAAGSYPMIVTIGGQVSNSATVSIAP